MGNMVITINGNKEVTSFLARSEVDLSDAELPDKDVKILEILARK